MKDTWDIVTPLDNWELKYALLAYQHTGLKMVGALKIPVVTKIEVKHVTV